MPTVLVTGANRGLGLEFVRQYAGDGWRVHACCREPDKAEALKKIAGDVVIHRLDVTDGRQLEALKVALAGEPIDVAINNAAVRTLRFIPITSMGDADWLESLRINSIAPLRIADALADNVAASKQRAMIFLTSLLGSIALTGANDLSYRMGKAALNMGVRVIAHQLREKGIVSLLIGPGWVRTEMGGATADLAPAESIAGMRAVIAGLTPSDDGRFVDYKGKDLPW